MTSAALYLTFFFDCKCSNSSEKSAWPILQKKVQMVQSWRFLFTGHQILPFCGFKVRETMVAKCELVL